jgi:ribosomal protein S18 acetylase RimI-like enzyme
MGGVAIGVAGPGDMADLHAALAHLAGELGGTCGTTVAALTAACTGPSAAGCGVIARENGAVAGAAILSPVFSSFRGCAGVFVNDLWVAPAARGTGLGRRLLVACAGEGARRWHAGYLRLDVHDDNTGGRAFYDRLGFRPAGGETMLVLDPPVFTDLLETA